MIKRCACGRVFDEAAWKELKIVGGMDPEDESRPDYVLELRQCTCQSTLAIEVSVETEQADALVEQEQDIRRTPIAQLSDGMIAYWREHVRRMKIKAIWKERRSL